MNLNFLNKDFGEFNDSLVQYIKDRFPNDYRDISQSNPGQIFISLAAYVGSVTSFYLDNQLQNVIPQYSTDIKSLLAYSYIQGYPIIPTTTSSVEVSITQLVPAKLVENNYIPDLSYSINIPSNTSLLSTANNVSFLTEAPLDFSYSHKDSYTEVSIYSYDNSNNPTLFTLTKRVNAIAGTLVSQSFTFNNPKKFDSVTINDDNILFIKDCFDSDGNRWYEVPYLGQNTIFKPTVNTNFDSNAVRNLLNIEKISKRFVSRFTDSNTLEIEFGAGIYNTNDLQLVPSLEAIKQTNDQYTNTYNPINPHSFLYTKEYGEAPTNTTLTINYVKGGGLQSNVYSDTITNIDTTNITFNGGTDPAIIANIRSTISVTNDSESSGGRGNLSLRDIKNNLISNFASQNRAINPSDYIVRTLSLPAQYGVVAKSFVQLENQDKSVVGIYALSLNSEDQFADLSPSLKQNLITYLKEYQSISDNIIVNSAYIINIAVDFEITVMNNYTPKEVLSRSITKLQEYFSKDNWQINQPILISDVFYTLSIVEGVQSVTDVNISNKSEAGYSSIAYDLKAATQNNVIYPSMDPSIFEVKFPNADIYGRVKII